MTPTIFARILRDISYLLEQLEIFLKMRGQRVGAEIDKMCIFLIQEIFFIKHRHKKSAFPMRRDFLSPLSSHLLIL